MSYHWARYYSVPLARWISCDPIGQMGGTNLFCYCLCNPLIHVDNNGKDFQVVVDPEAKTITIEANIITITQVDKKYLDEAAAMWNRKTYTLPEGDYKDFKLNFNVSVELDQSSYRQIYEKEMKEHEAIQNQAQREAAMKRSTDLYATHLMVQTENVGLPTGKLNNVYFAWYYPGNQDRGLYLR